jgi:hypothetical protein
VDPPEKVMDREEMIRVLEEIIRDEGAPATTRCTAIRTLLEIAPEPPSGITELEELYGLPPRRDRAEGRERPR